MRTANSGLLALAAALALIVPAGAGPAVAQNGLPNLDQVSPIEEALAMEVGDVTLTLTGAVEARYTTGSDEDEDNDPGLIGSLGLTAMTQLPNRWSVNLGYMGRLVSDEALSTEESEKGARQIFWSGCSDPLGLP